MLIVKIYGGLGNQMFQFAFFQFLRENNAEVYLDLSDFKIHEHHQGFELKKVFNVEFDEPTKQQRSKMAVNHNSIFYRGLRKGLGLSLSKITEFNEVFHGVIVEEGEYDRDIYFTGFWQNAVYVKKVERKLREQFKFCGELSGRNRELAEQIERNISVSVHVRCGDYINNTSLGGICDKKYYENAIRYMQDKYPQCCFFVFSDDCDLVKNSMSFPEETQFIDWNKGAESFIDMRLMGLCNHNIIANSSFSWWGAWLNSNVNKTVIMPKNWYRTQTNNPLVWEDWIRL